MKGQAVLSSQGISETRGYSAIFKLLSQYRALTLAVIIGIYFLIFSLVYPSTFATYGNISKVLMSMSIEAFIVMAMAMLLIGGTLDLSVGGNMAMAGVLCGYLIKFAGTGVALAIIITLLVSVVMGLINGFIVARIGVNPVVTTLATALIFQGIAVWLAGPGLTDFPIPFQAFAQNKIFMLQMPIWYTLVIIIVFSYFMSNTRYFRQYYYIGGNVKAAILSGINMQKMKIIGYIIASLLASTAGIISAARFNSAMVSIGSGVELRAITAAVVGGISFSGGSGTILGAAMGALFISFLNNGLVIAGLEPYWQHVVTGVVLVLSIIADIAIARKQA